MRDVGDEQPLDLGQLLPGLDLRLQGGRHLVEGPRQRGDLVLSVDGQALAQAAAGQALGGQGRAPDGDQDAPGQTPDPQDEHEEEARAGDDHGPGGQVDDVLLRSQGVDQEEVVVAGQRQGDPLPDDEARAGAAAGVHADRLPVLPVLAGALGDGGGQVLGDQRHELDVGGQVVDDVGRGLRAAPLQDDADAAGPGEGLADGGDLRLGDGGHLVRRRRAGGVEGRLDGGDPQAGVGEDDVAPVGEDVVADPGRDDHQEDDDQDDAADHGEHRHPGGQAAPDGRQRRHEAVASAQAGAAHRRRRAPAPGDPAGRLGRARTSGPVGEGHDPDAGDRVRRCRRRGSPRPGRSPRSPGARDRARSWRAAAGRAR